MVAAPAEAKAVLAGLGGSSTEPIPEWRAIPVGDRFEVVVTGVGKANGAGGAGRACDPSRHAAVVNIGVAGALPGSNLPMSSVVLASQSVFADEGVITPDGFITLDEMGFSPTAGDSLGVAGARDLIAALDPVTDRTGVITTVSTCSGTDAQAIEVQRRTGAIAEAMEGAAVGCVIERLNNELASNSIPFAELRVISNTTGDRDHQDWDLAGALDRLRSIVSMF